MTDPNYELERRVPAAGQSGRLQAIFVAERANEPSARYDRARLIVQRGLAGCRLAARAKPGGLRQVLLIDAAVLRRLDLAPGVLKENLLVEGLALDGLMPGQRLAVGDEVLLEITMGCPPCPLLEAIRPGLMRESWGYRGVLARVLAGGAIAVGAAVALRDVDPTVRRPRYPALPKAAPSRAPSPA